MADFLTSGHSINTSGKWNMLQFTLLCVYTLGLDGMWKFPYLVYQHTGLFLVAYYILMVLVVVPVAFVQLKLGTTLQRGAVAIFSHYSPIFKGVAIAGLVYTFMQCVYQHVYMGYSLFYMIASMKSPYAWNVQNNTTVNHHGSEHGDDFRISECPSEHYFKVEFLQKTESISDPGSIPWYLAVVLLAAWSLTYLAIFRGPSWFGKVLYVSSPLCMSILISLMVYGHIAMPAAPASLAHFFNEHQFHHDTMGHDADEHEHDEGVSQSQLSNPLLWINALKMHVFNIALWSGLLPTLAKNMNDSKPKGNLLWLVLMICQALLTHLSTIAFAPYIHALAVKKNIPFEQVITKGTDLIFVIFPDVFSTLELPPVWPILLYLSFVLTMLHQHALFVMTVVENVIECHPNYVRSVFRRREVFSLVVCLTGFLLGLTYITQGGSYMILLVSRYMYRCFSTIITGSIIPYVMAYMKYTSHQCLERVLISIWFTMASLFVAGFLEYDLVEIEMREPVFPHQPWTAVLGWLVAGGPMALCLIVGVIHACCNEKSPLPHKLIRICQSEDDDVNNLPSVDHADFITSPITRMNGGYQVPPKPIPLPVEVSMRMHHSHYVDKV